MAKDNLELSDLVSDRCNDLIDELYDFLEPERTDDTINALASVLVAMVCADIAQSGGDKEMAMAALGSLGRTMLEQGRDGYDTIAEASKLGLH